MFFYLPKHFLDVNILFSRGLKELDAHLICKLSSVLSQDYFSLWIVGLVPDQDPVYDVTVLVDFMKPSKTILHNKNDIEWWFYSLPFDISKGVARGDVVDHDDAVRAAVVRGSDCAEALLPGRVPNLKFNPERERQTDTKQI